MSPVAAEPRGTAGDRTYQPHLDGLRAVAVYLVVVFHAGSGRFAGGYVGVDVFFVLSGFLVTQLLMRDLVPTGSVGFRRFYSRRFRRLLPAAFVALVVTALVFSAVATPVEVAASAGGFKASFLYSANWYFIEQSSQYFGEDVTSNPVLHFWSLAVEEQFYLVWPLLLAGLFAAARRFGARQGAVLRTLVAIGAVASCGWAWSLRDSDPNRAYYGTDARAYQLLAGALLALSPQVLEWLARFPRAGRRSALAGVAGLVLVGSSWVHLDAIERGVVVTSITMVVIVALEVARGGLARWVLSTEPMVYLGKVSYGTYLWHWPIIVVITRTFQMSTMATVLFTTLLATALASLSFQLMEHPIRVSELFDRHRSPVIAAGLAVSVISALALIPAIVDRSTSSATAAARDVDLATAGFTPVPDIDLAAVDRDFPAMPNCFNEPASDCIAERGRGVQVLVIGDSHGAMITPAFEVLAREEDLTLSIAVGPGCPWQQGVTISLVRNDGINPQDCVRDRADLYDRVLPELDPDLVVVMNRGYERPEDGPRYQTDDEVIVPVGTPEFDALLEESTTRSLDRLTADGRHVILIEPTPITARFNPRSCLETATVVEACRAVVDPRPTDLELLYRQLAQDHDRVWALDLDPLVCPYLPICDPIIDGKVVRKDGSHMTRTFSRSLAPAILEYLTTNGIVPTSRP